MKEAESLRAVLSGSLPKCLLLLDQESWGPGTDCSLPHCGQCHLPGSTLSGNWNQEPEPSVQPGPPLAKCLFLFPYILTFYSLEYLPFSEKVFLFVSLIIFLILP